MAGFRRKHKGKGISFSEILSAEEGTYCIEYDGDYVMYDNCFVMSKHVAETIVRDLLKAGRQARAECSDLDERAEYTRLLAATKIVPCRIH